MFRFTIRDLLWLMVVVAVASGWFAEHRQMTAPKWDADVNWDGIQPSEVWIDPDASNTY